MQTPEEIKLRASKLCENLKGNKTPEEIINLLFDEIDYLSGSNQTLLDEVNRLNGVIEKQGKVIKELRDE